MAKALAEMARDALAVQDACNLTGVAHSFSVACCRLREAMKDAGLATDTESVNRHPVVVLWVDKLCQLAGLKQDSDAAADAWRACEELAKGG
jgi:23S rRNA C2498 (ribose-2'-O)-methylase RlmM